MGSNFRYEINAVPSGAGGGPYTYIVFKDGVGVKDVNALADAGVALDGVKATVIANLAGETVKTITGQVFTS